MDFGQSGSGRDGDEAIVTQLLLSRGVSPDDLERHRRPTLRDFLPDPSLFRDMDEAARRLADAILRNEKITIYGDYDVDGATSAALLILLLRDLGVIAGHYIPDRLLEGYGPSGEALVRLAQQGSQLIVTSIAGQRRMKRVMRQRGPGSTSSLSTTTNARLSCRALLRW
mgnify:CR=1 FL=1